MTLLEEQKYYTQLAVECIPSQTMRDFLHAKNEFVLPTLDMMALGAMSSERIYHQTLNFLEAVRKASFLTELETLYLENEIAEYKKSEKELTTTYKYRILVAEVRKDLTSGYEKFQEYFSFQECLEDLKKNDVLSNYMKVRIIQCKKSQKEYEHGSFGIDKTYKPINWFSRKYYCTQLAELLAAINAELEKENGVFLGACWHELKYRYVRLPVPFKKGDIVKVTGTDELLVTTQNYIINERLIRNCWDDSDMQICCMPIEFKEKIREGKEDEISQDDWGWHQHKPILDMELVESWQENK